jgi:hypothetical protein
MEQTSFSLPIRLLPRKGSQLFRIVFFIFFTGFAIFWITMAASFTWFSDRGPTGQMWLFNLFPLFGFIFLGVGAWQLVSAIAKLLPGSPYHHLEISSEGLLIRTMRRKQQFGWNQVSAFDVSVRERRDKDGDTHHDYYVVALPAADAAKLSDERERYNRAVLRIDADEFGADDASADAADLSSWLNMLRESAVSRRLAAHDEVSVPPGFRASVWSPSGQAPQPALANSRRQESVIQR